MTDLDRIKQALDLDAKKRASDYMRSDEAILGVYGFIEGGAKDRERLLMLFSGYDKLIKTVPFSSIEPGYLAEHRALIAKLKFELGLE